MTGALHRLWCWIFGHDFYVLQKFSQHSRRVCCDRCGGDWAMNDNVRAIVPWSGEFEEMYRLHGHRILKR